MLILTRRPGGTVELLPVHLIRFLDTAPDFPDTEDLTM